MKPAVKVERPVRSYSSLKRHQRCAVNWKFRYVENIPDAAGTAAIRGTAPHVSSAHNYRSKMRRGVDLPLSEVLDVAAQAVDERFAGAVHLTREERSVGLAFVKGRVRDMGVRLARRYHLNVAPHVRPIMVEEKIVVRPDPAVLPVDLVAVLDLADDRDRVRDLKTKEVAMQEGLEHSDQQLTLQAMMFRTATGRMPSEVGFDVVTQPRNLQRPATHEYRPSQRGPSDFDGMIRTLAVTEAAIQAGNFPPTDPTNWICRPKWCSYWEICPYVAGRRARGEG